jgi:hypothetical protein
VGWCFHGELASGWESCTPSAKRAGHSIHITTVKERTNLNFVIPTGAQRSRGICSSFHQQRIRGMGTRPILMAIPVQFAGATRFLF